MKFEEAYKGQFLKAADLNGKVRRLTIKTINQEDVGDDSKVVVRFVGESRALVLNRTNGGILRLALGDELDDWVGHDVLLKPDKTDFQGKRVDCIRVAVPAKKAPAPDAETEAGDGADDVNV